ncbi:hypothetical protein [Arthrobacter woluwensis]|uniref:hypothetical protein n=1 Tax=Arthrobacter woluwensis TaxID=156980 RepID=UPI0038000779
MGWTKLLVAAWGNLSFSSIHGILNGYGKAIVLIRFRDSLYLHRIVDAVQAIGWQIETDRWDAAREVRLFRSGPAIVGKQDELVRELSVALASIPNQIMLLEPEVSMNNYARLPKWTVWPSPVIPGEKAKSPRTVFGSKPDNIFPPPRKIEPANAAAKILSDTKLWTWTADRRVRRQRAWLYAVLVSSMVGGWMLASHVQENDQLLAAARNIPVVAVLYWSGKQFSLGFWLWIAGLTLGLALLGALLFGLVKIASLTVTWVRRARIRRSQNTKADTAGDPLPMRASASLSGQDLPRPLSSGYSWIFWPIVVLYGLGIGYALPAFWGAAADLLRESGPNPWSYAVITGVIWAGTGIVLGLWSAARKMKHRRSRRVALSLGALLGAGTILLRAPAWAYADGLGAPWLWDSFDWTSLLSLSTQFVWYLVFAAVIMAIVLWFFRLSPQTFRILFAVPIMYILLLQGFLALSPAWEAGYSLAETGKVEHARGDYPIAACLQPVHNSQSAGSSMGSSVPAAVWILALKDGRLIITDRSQDAKPLPRPGRIQSLPAADYALQIVRTPGDSKDDLCPRVKPS